MGHYGKGVLKSFVIKNPYNGKMIHYTLDDKFELATRTPRKSNQAKKPHFTKVQAPETPLPIFEIEFECNIVDIEPPIELCEGAITDITMENVRVEFDDHFATLNNLYFEGDTLVD